MASICRLCATLKKVENFVHIHDPNLNLCMKLEKCCQLKILRDDVLPQNVCNDCVLCLEASWKFAERVKEAQESLQKIFVSETSVKDEGKILYHKLATPVTTTNIQSEPDAESVVIVPQQSQEKQVFKVNIECLKVEDFEEVAEDEAATMNDGGEMDDDKVNEIVDIIEVSEEQAMGDAFQDYEETEVEETLVNDESQETWKDYPWNCRNCSTTYPSVDDLKKHFSEEHINEDVAYVCADCSKSFQKYYLLLNHVRTRHRPHLIYCCDVCSQVYENSVSLANHTRTVHEEHALVLCPVCGKGFKSEKALDLHSVCHRPENVRYKHSCPVCNKKFGTKPNLKAHMKIHSGLREFVCDQCGKSFVQKSNLEEHLLTHIDVKPFECQDCGKKFKTPARLAKHKTVHIDVKPHKCEQCGRMFREKDTLRVHLRIHTGAMPYECEFCGKKFRFRSILVTHRHQHTGVRPYSCLECNHHFTNWPNYNKHMKRVHGIDTSSSARKPRTTSQNDSTPSYAMPDNNSLPTDLDPASPTPIFSDPKSETSSPKMIKMDNS